MSVLEMKYFVLKPKGTDIYAEASRKAMRAYANHIQSVNEALYDGLREWADRESTRALERLDTEGKLPELPDMEVYR